MRLTSSATPADEGDGSRVINLYSERVFDVDEGHPCVSVPPRRIRFFVQEGVRNLTTGEVVKLEAMIVRHKLLSSVEAYGRFQKRLNGL